MEQSRISIFQRPAWVVVFALTAAIAWGWAFPLIKIGFSAFGITADMTGSKMLFAGIRFAAAGLIVLSVARGSGRSFKTGTALCERKDVGAQARTGIVVLLVAAGIEVVDEELAHLLQVPAKKRGVVYSHIYFSSSGCCPSWAFHIHSVIFMSEKTAVKEDSSGEQA